MHVAEMALAAVSGSYARKSCVGFHMNLTVQPMGRDDGLEILSWKYDEPYDFYNMDDDGIGELLNGTYFKVLENGVLIGYCCFGN